MGKKEKKAQRPELPVFSSEINPGMLAHELDPKAKNVLFEGRSAIAKEYYEKDMERLRRSMKIERLKPKLQMPDTRPIEAGASMVHRTDRRSVGPKTPDTGLRTRNIDLRTGKADVSSLLPKHVQIKDSRIPDHPEKALAAAMKKLNGKKLK